MDFELVEPLRYLFKDEVRAVGLEMGLPAEILWRQPFPGPGLAVRCVGEITSSRLQRLRQADHIFTQELAASRLVQSSPDDTQDIAQLLRSCCRFIPSESWVTSARTKK